MHISEGMLSLPVCATGFALAGGINAVALKNMSGEEIPRLAVMGAAFFIVSLFPIKVGPASFHLMLTGLMAMILGFRAVIAVTLGLFFQAVMFQHGGLSTLGVNSFVMGFPPFLFGFILKGFKSETIRPVKAGLMGALGGSLVIILSAALTYLFLVLGDRAYHGVAVVFSLSNLILALFEGIISYIGGMRIAGVKPEMLYPIRIYERN